MKRLQQPEIDDNAILEELAKNKRLKGTTYPELANQLADMIQAYNNYLLHSGNPWSIVQPIIPVKLKTGLISHYQSPPLSVKYLSDLRNSSPNVCPMCGGFHPTTLDHYLPKTDYPVWAIFSKNLVPACGCNMVRGDVVKSAHTHSVRVLHPYFDDLMKHRILTTSITHAPDFKWLNAEVICADPNHPAVDSINFHIENVIKKNRFSNWQKGQLSKLIEFPPAVIQTLSARRPVDKVSFVDALHESLYKSDRNAGTPNNWDSMLLHGLLNCPDVIDWLHERNNLLVVADVLELL